MIEIININLMRLDHMIYESENENYFMIKVMADPNKVSNVQTIKKTPLTTLCFKVSHDILLKLNNLFSDNFTDILQAYKLRNEVIIELLRRAPFKSINQFNDSEEYNDIISKFNKNDFYSTYIFYFDISDSFYDMIMEECIYKNGNIPPYNYDQTIVIGAFPINGIMRPIQRSENFILYNGCFIRSERYTDNDIISMPNFYGSPSAFKYTSDDITDSYKMTAYVVINLFTSFSLFVVDRLSFITGIITEHRLSGAIFDNYTTNYYKNEPDVSQYKELYPVYDKLQYKVPITKEQMFENASVNLFPICDRPYYAIPKNKDKPVMVHW